MKNSNFEREYKGPNKTNFLMCGGFALLLMGLGFQLPIVFNLLIGAFAFSVLISMIAIDTLRDKKTTDIGARGYFLKTYPSFAFWPLNKKDNDFDTLPKKAKLEITILASLSSWSFLAVLLYISAWLLKWI